MGYEDNRRMGGYNNDPQFEHPYGKLYNWFTVVDSRNVCPSGWYIPSDDEWNTFVLHLEARLPEVKWKKPDLYNWTNPNVNADNSGGFTGLPGGYRLNTGRCMMNMYDYGYRWSSVEYNPEQPYYCSLYYNNELQELLLIMKIRLSVRCLKTDLFFFLYFYIPIFIENKIDVNFWNDLVKQLFFVFPCSPTREKRDRCARVGLIIFSILLNDQNPLKFFPSRNLLIC